MSAYKSGSSALAVLLKQKELSLESIEETMDNLADVLADHREIESCLAQGNSLLNVGDDEEIDKELEGMIEMEREAKLEKHLQDLKIASHPMASDGGLTTQATENVSKENVSKNDTKVKEGKVAQLS